MSILQHPAFEATDVSFAYRAGVNAVSNVSLNVAPGEIVGLVGANGSGKSTLIRLAFDLLKPQHGNIRIQGAPQTGLKAKLAAQYLPSDDLLPEYLTGNEYLNLLHSMYEVERDDSSIDAWFSRFSMQGRATDLIEDYSHGMRKKLQLIAAFELKRPFLAVDETLNGIDLEAVHLAEQEFRNAQRCGVGLLLCTHDFELLARIADRIVLMAHGNTIVNDSFQTVVADYGSIHEMVRQLILDVNSA